MAEKTREAALRLEAAQVATAKARSHAARLRGARTFVECSGANSTARALQALSAAAKASMPDREAHVTLKAAERTARDMLVRLGILAGWRGAVGKQDFKTAASLRRRQLALEHRQMMAMLEEKLVQSGAQRFSEPASSPLSQFAYLGNLGTF